MERFARIVDAAWTFLRWGLLAFGCGAIWLARIPPVGLDEWLRTQAVPSALVVGMVLSIPAVGTTMTLRWLIPRAWVHVPIGVLVFPLSVWVLFTWRVRDGLLTGSGGLDSLANEVVLLVGVVLIVPAIVAWYGFRAYYRRKWARANPRD